jgi:hypothetical protein
MIDIRQGRFHTQAYGLISGGSQKGIHPNNPARSSLQTLHFRFQKARVPSIPAVTYENNDHGPRGQPLGISFIENPETLSDAGPPRPVLGSLADGFQGSGPSVSLQEFGDPGQAGAENKSFAPAKSPLQSMEEEENKTGRGIHGPADIAKGDYFQGLHF